MRFSEIQKIYFTFISSKYWRISSKFPTVTTFLVNFLHYCTKDNERKDISRYFSTRSKDAKIIARVFPLNQAIFSIFTYRIILLFKREKMPVGDETK